MGKVGKALDMSGLEVVTGNLNVDQIPSMVGGVIMFQFCDGLIRKWRKNYASQQLIKHWPASLIDIQTVL